MYHICGTSFKFYGTCSIKFENKIRKNVNWGRMVALFTFGLKIMNKIPTTVLGTLGTHFSTSF